MRIDGGEPEGFVNQADELDCKATTVLLCKQIGDALEKHYPGWMWAIQPDELGGLLTIMALRLSGEWGYVFKLADLQGDAKVAMQKVMRGGGEILERFSVPRGTYRYADWAATRKDIAGMAVVDLADKSAGIRKQQRMEALKTAVASGQAQIIMRESDGPGGPRRDFTLRLEDSP